MPDGPLPTALRRLRLRALRWPGSVRDLTGVSLALVAVIAGEVLLRVLPVPAETLLTLPGVLVAWSVFGGRSAAVSAGAAGLAVIVVAQGRTGGTFEAGFDEALILLALAAALIAAGLGAQAWAKRREGRALRLLDACAADALGRIEDAHRRLATAEAEAAAARGQLTTATKELSRARRALARDGARDGGPGPPASPEADFDEALRREGGV